MDVSLPHHVIVLFALIAETAFVNLAKIDVIVQKIVNNIFVTISINEIMEIKFYSKEKLKKEILEIAGKYLDIKDYKIFFFGSRATGQCDERSDIDIGIEGKGRIPFETIADIRNDVSNLPTLYKIDIVDFKDVDNDFYKLAKQNLEMINND